MIRTEYVRNMNCNYERLLLEKKPEENRYQYCILNRGGIRYLLPCSLRYIDNEAYLYYDITSTQNLARMFLGRQIDREWMRHFLWGLRQVWMELDRYLLDRQNLIYDPEHIFQDMEKNDFYFLYVPYYKGDTGFAQLLDQWVERADYEDEPLVDFVYNAYERYRLAGEAYLDRQIFEDYDAVEHKKQDKREDEEDKEDKVEYIEVRGEEQRTEDDLEAMLVRESRTAEKKGRGLSFLLEGRRKRQEKRDSEREALRMRMSGRAVAEEIAYYGGENTPAPTDREEEYGRTIYIEESAQPKEHGLYRENGELAARLDHFPFRMGKLKGEAELVLNDLSVSRIHARILEEQGKIYLEDLNSTNGTFKNGLRLQPYERRELKPGDEIRLGRLEFAYR